MRKRLRKKLARYDIPPMALDDVRKLARFFFVGEAVQHGEVYHHSFRPRAAAPAVTTSGETATHSAEAPAAVPGDR